MERKKVKKVYQAPVLDVTVVTMEQSIAQVPISAQVSLESWEEDPIPAGEVPAADGGDFYVFY